MIDRVLNGFFDDCERIVDRLGNVVKWNEGCWISDCLFEAVLPRSFESTPHCKS